MKILKVLLIIALSLGLISCTESIAPELEEANNGGGGGPTGPGVNILKTFSVDVIKDQPNDSVVMHKANHVGTEKCKIEAISLDADSPVYQDCVIDIEELDLYHDGFKVDISVTDKLCEYVAFQPYKFYTHPVGASSGAYTDSSACACGGCPAHNPPPANACQFNHGNGNDCDMGSYTVDVWASAEEDDGAGGTTCVVQAPAAPTPFDCGGNELACVMTPNPEILGNDMSMIGALTKVVDNSDDNGTGDEEESQTPFYSISYEFAGGITQGFRTNAPLANFSNQCSGLNQSLNMQTGMNLNNVQDKFYKKSISETVSGGIDGIAFAASPLLGYHAQPLYLAQCLNQAGDVKAEIRFVVREWDKRFVDHTNPAILSYVRINGWLDTGYPNQQNNYRDIDDFIQASGKNYFNNACHTTALPLSYDPDHFFYNNF